MIRLDGVTKRFRNGVVAVEGLDLEVAEGEVCVLVGPSGCGKTTTMKMVNRLVEPTSGRVLVGGEDVSRLDPVTLRRRIGYVIQQGGLFPHRNVAANVATVLRLLGWERRRREARVDELLSLVGLEPSEYRERFPDELSGGQRQRIGVARALAADPPVLLMDEPFGALDPVTRERLQEEFLRLQGQVRKTVVFVTHDIDEAARLGDRIAVLGERAAVLQHDRPAVVLAQPASDFVARFVGSERALLRLGVLGIDLGLLEHPPLEVEGQAGAVEVSAELRAGPRVVVDRTGGLLGRTGRGAAAAGAIESLHRVGADASLREALAAMLLDDLGWVAVVEGERFLGLLTPASLLAAARQPGESP